METPKDSSKFAHEPLPTVLVNDVGVGIPHPMEPHPGVDYSKYYIDKTPLNEDAHSNAAITVRKIEAKGGVEKFLWAAVNGYPWDLDERVTVRERANAVHWFTKVVVPARIETLAAYEGLDQPMDWVYTMYAIGYELSHIANTLRIRTPKLFALLSADGDMVRWTQAKQIRHEMRLDQLFTLQGKMINANMDDDDVDASKRAMRVMAARAKIMEANAAFSVHMAKAYSPDFAPKKQVIELAQPSINITL